mmetsp:Transcript_24105/g.23710  ORF Transcript_24105/g.23710 Transcript_24105/m.23710 type:complete len:187 (+) Transcript_24105:149-709(+)
MEYINKQGWGYKDTYFVLEPVGSSNKTILNGNRYMFSGKNMSDFESFGRDFAGIDWSKRIYPQQDMDIEPPVFNHDFMKDLGDSFSRRSFLKWERIMHSHGATLLDVFVLRYGKFKRFADLVLYPETNEHVETIVMLANKHNVCLVPYGGGTNVTNSLQLSPQEKRMIVSLDMTRMNKIKWVDREN